MSPLRYPGGKRKLFAFFCDLLAGNDLVGGHYVEPFAGGAGLALSLLISGVVGAIHLNDFDRALYTFWRAVLSQTDELCQRIYDAPVTVEEWHRQRRILAAPERHSDLEVAFAVFFLNRTNRSGILRGGVIGGQRQIGDWKLDARFSRAELVRRIERIAALKERITLDKMDAVEFLQKLPDILPGGSKVLIYADPPYYRKGPTLYYSYYQPADHQALSRVILDLPYPWMVTYDDIDAVYELYQQCPYVRFQLHYSAQLKRRSGEVMFHNNLAFPALPSAECQRQWGPVYFSGEPVAAPVI